ncbi:MAG: PqiC family protein [Aquirhabdus sp.]
MNTINYKMHKLSLGLGIGVSLLLGACSTSSTPNYYTLISSVVAMPSNALRVIEVMPVGLPERLDRTQIVLQEASGKSEVLDQQRWTSTLSAELRDGLSAGLQQRLGAVDRYRSGSTTTLPVYRIATDFSHFDVIRDQSGVNINVAVTWTINRVQNVSGTTATVQSKSQVACRMAFSTLANTKAYPEVNAMVGASRQSLDRVASAISASVLVLEGGAKPADAVCS